ncbi:membrane or secreted protein [Spirosoma montaniterrae]|uniref:Membrane or secreted protein n=1 Tax=Spirosoma montaniterrae TaxID=1178516 RepID=A0A1P9WW37_9BACT|nr:membrane or secreted protein [Spirosoma montaniterrae]AQG79597.1 membrane or secreted protein [Spirosoma montaniterrae]
MKTLAISLGLLVMALTAALQPAKTALDGAWRTTDASGVTVMLTVVDNYLMQTTYEPNRFIGTRGGVCQPSDDAMTLTVEFDTQDSSRVGQTETYKLALKAGQLTLNGPSGNRTFTRVDEPSAQTPMAGLWRITGRANDAGQITTMQRGARKTIKLLTGSRFQWAAINPQTKQFSGTGGGTYTAKDGQYTETIDFFSRDNSRVGRSLTFGAAVNGNEWRHTGQSSTGGKVDEIWTRER